MRRRDLTASLALWLSVVGCAAQAIELPQPAQSPGVDLVSLPVCSDSILASRDTSGAGYARPAPTQIMIPEAAMRLMRGRGDVVVRYLVAANGRVDSVAASGVTRPDETAAFRQDASGMRFRPAHFRDCRLQGWAMLTMTFQ